MVTTVRAGSLPCLSQCVVSPVEGENEVSKRSFDINALGVLCYGRASGSIVSVMVFQMFRLYRYLV